MNMGYPRAHGHHGADTFVTGNKGQGRFNRPVAINGVQIGMANATGRYLSQNLSGARRRNGDLLKLQRLTIPVQNGGLHG